MAKKPRAKAMAGDGAKRVISANAFSQLLKEIKAAEADKNESVGTMGGLISEAVEKHNVNKKALSWYRAAERMSGAKLRDVLEQFEHYCDIGGLNARAQQQSEMYSAEERGTTFAEKLQTAREQEGNGAPPPRRRRAKAPSPAEVAAIADRAEHSDELH